MLHLIVTLVKNEKAFLYICNYFHNVHNYFHKHKAITMPRNVAAKHLDQTTKLMTPTDLNTN